jgi:hypothetical protein
VSVDIAVATKPHKGIAVSERIFVDDPDAKKFYLHTADAMILDVGDIIPNRGELWMVRIVKRKSDRKSRDGNFWQITIESPRGTSYSFDPRWDRLGRDDGDPELRNLSFYRPRKGF